MRTKILFVLAILIHVVLLSMWLYYYYAPYSEFERLLGGDKEIEVESLTLTGQGREIKLDDPATAKYLSESFRGASRERPATEAGYTYYAHMKFKGSGRAFFGCDTPEKAKANGITISYPFNSLDDPIPYWIEFREPIPPPVAAALAKMRHPPVVAGHENSIR